MDYDTIIIGAGMAGLAAGIRLAHYGHSVCLLERQSRVGGLNTVYSRAGRQWETGLHAVTNFAGVHARRHPLNRALRQLRLDRHALQLRAQDHSVIQFPAAALTFTNRIEALHEGIRHRFPDQADRFGQLVQAVRNSRTFEGTVLYGSARAFLAEYITDPLLRDMILCPVMYYGNPAEHDMDLGLFCTLFQSIYLEGLARPQGGMQSVLNILRERFRQAGGELSTATTVTELHADSTRVNRIVLHDGRSLSSHTVVSTAGYPETLRLVRPQPPSSPAAIRQSLPGPGILSVVETILLLDCSASQAGFNPTLLFLSKQNSLAYRRPAGQLVDGAGLVACSPDNFQSENATRPGNAEGGVRLTSLADCFAWESLSAEQYDNAKTAAVEQQIPLLEQHRNARVRRHIVGSETITPCTIQRYTGRIHGAVYGIPDKRKDGTTTFENLLISGTDQGFEGITGALIGGVNTANKLLST